MDRTEGSVLGSVLVGSSRVGATLGTDRMEGGSLGASGGAALGLVDESVHGLAEVDDAVVGATPVAVDGARDGCPAPSSLAGDPPSESPGEPPGDPPVVGERVGAVGVAEGADVTLVS